MIVLEYSIFLVSRTKATCVSNGERIRSVQTSGQHKNVSSSVIGFCPYGALV